MANSRADRFVGNGESDVVFGKGTRFHLMAYPVDESILEKSEQEVLNRLHSDFNKNPLLGWAWREGQIWYDRYIDDVKKNAIRQVYGSDNQIFAAIAYTLETPKMYAEFNKQTRDNSFLDRYDYNNYYYFLQKALAAASESTIIPSTLYRGNSVRFTTEKGMVGCFRSFTSTSSNRNVPLGFLGDPKSSTLFQIKDATVALPLNDVSVIEGEEVFNIDQHC